MKVRNATSLRIGAVDLSTLPVATHVDWVRWLVREDDPRLKGRKLKRAAK